MRFVWLQVLVAVAYLARLGELIHCDPRDHRYQRAVLSRLILNPNNARMISLKCEELRWEERCLQDCQWKPQCSTETLEDGTVEVVSFVKKTIKYFSPDILCCKFTSSQVDECKIIYLKHHKTDPVWSLRVTQPEDPMKTRAMIRMEISENLQTYGFSATVCQLTPDPTSQCVQQTLVRMEAETFGQPDQKPEFNELEEVTNQLVSTTTEAYDSPDSSEFDSAESELNSEEFKVKPDELQKVKPDANKYTEPPKSVTEPTLIKPEKKTAVDNNDVSDLYEKIAKPDDEVRRFLTRSGGLSYRSQQFSHFSEPAPRLSYWDRVRNWG